MSLFSINSTNSHVNVGMYQANPNGLHSVHTYVNSCSRIGS